VARFNAYKVLTIPQYLQGFENLAGENKTLQDSKNLAGENK
jgi:hypothetical protein